MERSCPQCGTSFVITDDDLAFLEKVSPVFGGKKELIPPPTLCPDCRQQRRMAFRNQIHVYQRPSSSTGETIFSSFDASSPVRVVNNEEWWSDRWDPLSYGCAYDFSHGFFEQCRLLQCSVPHMARSVLQLENSDYCTNASNVRNSYFVFHTTGADECLYCEKVHGSRDCIDCTYTLTSEICHDCIWCQNCYNLRSSSYCNGCSDSFLLRFCIGCRNCFGCANLRHREYCIFNEQKTKEEFDAFMERINWQSRAQHIRLCAETQAVLRECPLPHAIVRQSENAEGNCITESRNIRDSYFIHDSESLRYCFSLITSKDCQDHTVHGDAAELVYEGVVVGERAQHIAFSTECWEGCSNLLYCIFCPTCSDCFGCVGLKKKRYCILNKQYTKEEYNALVPKIIAQMRETGEWGEFFPLSMSPYAYNHTIAQRYYPLTKEQVEALGGRWLEETMPEAAQAIEASALPDGLPETDDPIIVRSERSGRPFKITSREIKRYRQFRVPLPRLTYDERMEDRAKILGGITLYDRTCAKTGKPIKTTIPPDSPWIVWEREEWEREYGS